MSKDSYYPLPQANVSNSRPEEMSLPSFPSTSYWYDAHSKSGITVYTQSHDEASEHLGGANHIYIKNNQVEPVKHAENGKQLHSLQCWPNDTQEVKTYQEEYWTEPVQESEYMTTCEVTGIPVEYEPVASGGGMPPIRVIVTDNQPQSMIHNISEGDKHVNLGENFILDDSDECITNLSMTSSEDYPQSNCSNDATCINQRYNSPSESLVSPEDPLRINEDYYQHSNSDSDISLQNSKKPGGSYSSSDPHQFLSSPEDPLKRGQKRQKKDVKEKQLKDDKKCGVCGDTARSMHFGGMACDSCKAFFRRSVQSGAYRNFQCSEKEQCPISKQNRKVCQYCRFKKSRENGMEISWVMSETDRMTLWKNRLAKQRHVQEEKDKEVVYGNLPRNLNPAEADKLKHLASIQETAFKSIEYPSGCYGDTPQALANLFVCICKKLGHFFTLLDDFKTICKEDQNLLLKNGVGMSIYLHGAYMFDSEKEAWPAESNKESLKIPPVSLSNLKVFTRNENAYNALMKFYRKYGKDFKDEIVLVLMCVIAFFQADGGDFKNPQRIQYVQDIYLEHLRNYLLAKEGDPGAKVTFPRLLVGLADVKEILAYHEEVPIQPTISHQQINNPTSSYKNQVSSVMQMFDISSQGMLASFASVLNPAEQVEMKKRRYDKSLTKRHKDKSGSGALVHSGDSVYHSQINQIFGSNPRTDMLISNPMDQINLFMQRHKFSLTQAKEASNMNSSVGAVTIPHRYYNRGYNDDIYRKSRQASVCSGYDMESEPSQEHHMQVVPTSHNSYSYANCSSSSSSDSYSYPNRKAVEILCDILKQISCSDNDNYVQQLKQSIPPKLLNNIAQNLSPP